MWHLLCDNECHLNIHKDGENIEKYIVNEHIQGDPLSEENLETTLELVNKFRLSCPEKAIWLYTGYTWEKLFEDDDFDLSGGICENQTRRAIVLMSDVIVDGKYIDSQRDITLRWRGSLNQRVIDIQLSLQKGEIILWTK